MSCCHVLDQGKGENKVQRPGKPTGASAMKSDSQIEIPEIEYYQKMSSHALI